MILTNQKKDQFYPDAETEARREAALKTMFATPHKPQRPIREKRVESHEK